MEGYDMIRLKKPSWMLRKDMYNLILSLLLIFLLPYILIKISSRKTRKEWLERTGFIGDIPKGKYIWIHCASVGEVKTVQGFIQRLSGKLKKYKFIS